MRRWGSVVLFLFIWQISTSIFALDSHKVITQYIHETWGSDDGLPQNTIMAILQTRDGYLWLGTAGGLVRFDGAKFTTFNRRTNTSFKLDMITALYEDPQGKLWVGTAGGGILCKDGERFFPYTTKDGLVHDYVLDITGDTQGNIWIATEGGLCCHNQGKYRIWTVEHGLSSNNLRCLFVDRDNSLWIGTIGKGVNHFKDGTFSIYKRKEGLPDSNINFIYRDFHQNLWIGTEGGIALFKDKKFTNLTINEGLPANNVRAILADSNRNLWIGIGGKLCRTNQEKLSANPELQSLVLGPITSMVEDREGSLWIGTVGNRLHRLRDAKFTCYTTSEKLSDNYVLSIFQTRDKSIWMGTKRGGLNRFVNGRFTNYFYSGGILFEGVISMCQDRLGRLWIGTEGGGLKFMRGDGWSTDYFNRHGLSNNVVRVLCASHDQGLWIGTHGGGLNYFKDGKFTQFTTDNGLSNNTVLSLYEDTDHTLWIGTGGGGLNRFKANKIDVFSTGSGLSNNHVWTIHQCKDGILWLGTQGGLNRFHDGVFTAYTTQSGLENDTIFQILEDDEGFFWLHCSSGVLRVSKKELLNYGTGAQRVIHSVLMGKEDGMKSVESHPGGTQPTAIRGANGRLWFATLRGVAMIDPKNLKLNPLKPPVIIEKVVVDGKEYYSKSGEGDKPLIFPAGREKFEFHFTALSYVVPGRVKFKCRLQGYDSGWVDKDSQRTANYMNISPGHYTFQVMACNNDGIWNETGASFPFYFKPFFYQTWYFYLIFTVLLIFLSFGIAHLRLHRVKKREKELVELVGQRTKDLLDINTELAKANEFKSNLLNIAAHDLKNPLQLIMGYSDLIRKDQQCPEAVTNKVDLIARSSHHMVTLLNDMLNSAVIDNGQMKLKMEQVNLSELTHFVIKAYSPMAYQKEQKILPIIEEDIFVMADKRCIREVLENLLSNAIKYSHLKKSIWVSLIKRSGYTLVEVKDEGPGFTPGDKKKIFGQFQRLSARPTAGESSTGLGLSIVKTYIDMHNGQIKVESEPGAGSRFVIQLPLLKQVRKKLKRLAVVDAITGIASENRYADFYHLEWRRSKRFRKPISVIFIDIDAFKPYYEANGHEAANTCLRRIAQELQKMINRPGDLLARGEDHDFAIILSDTGTNGVKLLSDRLRMQVEFLALVHKKSRISPFVTISLGCASQTPGKDEHPNTLLKQAVIALQKAKRSGGNKAVVFEPK